MVRDPAWVGALVWVGFPLLGAAACFGVLRLADWVVTLPWVPFEGPFRLVSELPELPATIGALVVGMVLGVVVALLAAADSVRVTVSDGDVMVERGGEEIGRFAASRVASAFLDGKRLVVLDPAGAELVRESSDLEAADLEAAFRAHGYRWLAEGDPFGDRFRRWVEDEPALDPGANAVLRARQKALEKDDKDDVADLRRELAKLGVVVREEKKRQYWRVVDEAARGKMGA